MITKNILDAYDFFLQQRNVHLEAIIVGGTGLNLLGYISRQTRDVDIIAPELSDGQKQTSKDFCLAMSPTAEELHDALHWVIDQDTNELWPDHVRASFLDLQQRLGHDT